MKKNVSIPLLLKKNKILFLYAIFNYIDKGISLIIPLTILKLFNDLEYYNSIEYILSSSIILSTVLDLGLSSYYFFGYRNEEEKVLYVKKIEQCYSFLFFIEFIIIIIFLVYYGVNKNENLMFFICIMIRSVFVSFSTFKLNTYRLTNSPHRIFLITIPVNLVAFLIFILGYNYSSGVIWYFSGLLIFELLFLFRSIYSNKMFLFKDIAIILKKGMLYSWPVIINVFVLNYLMNYGKIYAFSHMSTYEMTNISLIQRFMIIITLAHSSAASFYLKQIYDQKKLKIDNKIMKSYNLMIIGAIFIMIFAVLLNNYFNFIGHINFNIQFVFLLIFYILNSYSAFFGTYFSVLNKNKIRLLACSSLLIIFIGSIWIIKPDNLAKLTGIMTLIMSFYFIFVVIFLLKKKIISFNL